MSDITLKAIEDLLDLKLDEKFDQKLKPINETLRKHTEQLDSIAKGLKTLTDDKTVVGERLERLEHWGEKVSHKVGINLDL